MFVDKLRKSNFFLTSNMCICIKAKKAKVWMQNIIVCAILHLCLCQKKNFFFYILCLTLHNYYLNKVMFTNSKDVATNKQTTH